MPLRPKIIGQSPSSHETLSKEQFEHRQVLRIGHGANRQFSQLNASECRRQQGCTKAVTTHARDYDHTRDIELTPTLAINMRIPNHTLGALGNPDVTDFHAEL